MSDRIGFGSLSAAAHALRGAENIPIAEQVRFISDPLLQGRRVQRLADETAGLPSEVFNVLENIADQVAKVKLCGVELDERDLPYEGIRQDLDVLEKFAEQVIKYYNARDLNVSIQVIKSLEAAKTEASSITSLSEIYRRIQTVEARYRNDPQMSPDEFKDELGMISQSLKNLEIEIIKQQGEKETLLKARLAQVKDELAVATDLLSMEDHPGVMGGSALSLLHDSAEKIQQAKTFEELQNVIIQASQARSAIRNSSKNYQETGMFYEKLIQEIVANSVNKKIREMEEEIRQPQSAGPGETEDTEKMADTIQEQKEKLVSYHKLAKEWGGQHEEELEERIALIYETINGRANTMHKKLLEGIKKSMGDHSINAKMSELATRFLFVAEIGKDEIKPEVIFSDNNFVLPE